MVACMASGVVNSFSQSKRTSSSKWSVVLGVLCALFFVLCIGVLLAWAVLSDGFHNLGGLPDVCSTRGCIAAASRLAESINENISVCDDFYAMSCSRYHENPSSLPNFLDQLREITDNQLRGLLTARSVAVTESGSSVMVKELFAACTNFEARSRLGPKPLLDLLRNFPCAPILSECFDFNADFYSWERHSGMLDWFAGKMNLIVIDRDVHPSDSRRLILSFHPADLSNVVASSKLALQSIAQPEQSEYEPLLIVTLRQQIVRPLLDEIFEGSASRDEVLVDEIAEFILEIDKASSAAKAVRQPRAIISIAELTVQVPQVNWISYLNAEYSSYVQWSEADLVVVENISFFSELGSIIGRTARRTVANYLMLMTALNLREYLYNNLTTLQPRWKECIVQLSPLEPLAKMYAESRKDLRLKEVHSTLSAIRDSFTVEHSAFSRSVIDRVGSVAMKAGYPSRILDEEVVFRPFTSIVVNVSDYFTSATIALKRQRSALLASINKDLDADDSVNFPMLKPLLAYNIYENSLVVPAPFLQYPLWLPGSSPIFAVYGTLGVVLMQMLARVLWSAPDSAAALADAIGCIERPLESLLSPALVSSISESSDDVIYTIHLSDALNTALTGYLMWRESTRVGAEARLPSLDSFDTIQQFFLSFSTLFCSSAGELPGSIYRAVINAAAQNSNAFTRSFHCANTTRLYNRHTCT